MTDSPDLDKLADDAHGAVADVLGRHGAGMLIRFVAVTELCDEDGERTLWMLASPDSMQWEVKGLLTHALDIEHSATMEE